MKTNLYSELLKQFIQFSGENYKEYCIRDNCGVACLDFLTFAQALGMTDLYRVEGEFIADNPVYEIKDFGKEDLTMMAKDGLNYRKKQDRYKFMLDNGLYNRQCIIPHYWTKIGETVVDVVGDCQFIKTKLANDLNSSRYIQHKIHSFD